MPEPHDQDRTGPTLTPVDGHAVADDLWPEDQAPTRLLAAVPAYTGERPENALLLVGLADGRLDRTVSVPLGSVADRAGLDDLVDQLWRPGVDAALVAVIDPDRQDHPRATRGLAEDARAALAGRRVDVAWSTWVEALRPQAAWENHHTAHRGLLPDLQLDPTEALRAVLGGRLSLPGREAIRARMLAVPAGEPHETTEVRGLARRLRGIRELERALAYTATFSGRAIDRWGAVLAAAEAADRGTPAALLAAAYYLRGDARTARVALDIAASAYPELPLLRAVEQLAGQGLPPRSIHALSAFATN